MTKIRDTLPTSTEGWTKRLHMHLNFGSAGGAATYSIHDETGADTGIVYQYDTRKKAKAGKKDGEPAPTGFHVPAVDSEVYPTWAELVAAWPGLVEKARAAA